MFVKVIKEYFDSIHKRLMKIGEVLEVSKERESILVIAGVAEEVEGEDAPKKKAPAKKKAQKAESDE